MKKRNISPNNKLAPVKRERDPIPWRYCLLTLVCGLILVGGFFWAARQHFSAIDYGIRNAKLRQSKDALEAEQRRLYLTKEISLSPTEIKKVAKKIGLQDLTARSIEMLSPSKNSNTNSNQKTVNDNQKTVKAPGDRTDNENKSRDRNSPDKSDNKQTAGTVQNSGGSLTRTRIAKK